MLKKRNKICSSFDNYLLDILYNNFPFVFVLGEYRVSENKVSFSLSLLALRIVKQLAWNESSSLFEFWAWVSLSMSHLQKSRGNYFETKVVSSWTEKPYTLLGGSRSFILLSVRPSGIADDFKFSSYHA